MKKLLLFAFFGLALNLSAQSDPVEIYFNNQVWFQLTPYDSLIFDYTDSTGVYQNDAVQIVDFFSKGVIDTSTVYNGGNPNADEVTFSEVNGNVLTLTTTSIAFGGGVDTVDFVEIYKDAMNQDTALITYEDNGSGFVPIIKYTNNFTNGLLSFTEYFEYSSGVPVKAGQSVYYASSNRIDSADISITINGTNIVVQKTRNEFLNGKHLTFSLYEASGATGTTFDLTEQIVFTHDVNDNIVEAINHKYNGSSKSFVGRVQYLRRNGSNVSLSESALASLEIFPNPAKDVLHISEAQTCTYKIRSASGTLVKTGKASNGTISINDLKAGVYIIAVQAGNDQVLNTKFVKQ